MTTTLEEVPVLIVGGSLVGLTTSMLLAWHGIPSLAVERHPGAAIHPRAAHFHLRTLEILRSVGLEEPVRRASEDQFSPDGGINAMESLAGREIASYFADLNAGVAEFSPCRRLFLTQNVLEPMLRSHAEQLGGQIIYNTEATDVRQDAAGVTATLKDGRSGAERQVRARYLVAADGNRSPIRERLGIRVYGHGLLSRSVTIYFGADCRALLRNRPEAVVYIFNDTVRGFFRFERSGQSGFLCVNIAGDRADPASINVSEGITDERARELVRAAIGVPDLPVEINHVAKWEAVADVADTFQQGRIFLAGDAAHIMPPNGGFGGNTGIQDAHNLAWKLAYVLNGQADPSLLDTYTAERQPIGELTIEQAYSRYVTRVDPSLGTEGMQPLVDDFSMEIGYRYHSSAVIPEPDDDGRVHTHPRESRGLPGSRAPHVVLTRDGVSLSTHDLFGKRFVLLAGPEGRAWCQAARDLPVDAYCVGQALADPDGRFAEAYGLSPSGAALVRPDSFVAWRARQAGPNAGQELSNALGQLLGRRASPALA